MYAKLFVAQPWYCSNTHSILSTIPRNHHTNDDLIFLSHVRLLPQVPPDAIPRLKKLQSLLDKSSVGNRSVALLRASQSVHALLQAHLTLVDLENQEEWEKVSEGGAYDQVSDVYSDVY